MSEQKKYTNILSSDGEKESPSLIKHDDLLTDDILLNKVISDFSVGARTNRTMNLYCENCNFFFSASYYCQVKTEPESLHVLV